MALDTVGDYVTAARRLLQDTGVSVRYPTVDMVDALNNGFLEMRRIRPDAFIGGFSTFPNYSAAALTVPVALDPQLRMAFVYYVAGQMQLRDQEDTTDARSSAFLNKFVAQLLTIQA